MIQRNGMKGLSLGLILTLFSQQILWAQDPQTLLGSQSLQPETSLTHTTQASSSSALVSALQTSNDFLSQGLSLTSPQDAPEGEAVGSGPASEISLEAEKQSVNGPGYWNSGSYIYMWNNGEVFTQKDLASGVYEIEVWAVGQAGEGQKPKIQMRVDGRTWEEPQEIGNQNWQFEKHVFSNIQIEAGSHKIAAAYINDGPGKFVSIDKIVIRKTGELAPVHQVLEAETLSAQGGVWNSGQYQLLWANGEITAHQNITSAGIYELDLFASGQAANQELPKLQVKVDGVLRSDVFEVGSNAWTFKKYAVSGFELEAGMHDLSVEYFNQAAGRMVSVDRLVLRKVGELPEIHQKIEAESMSAQGNGLWNSGKYVMFWDAGELSKNFDFSEGIYEIEIDANGTPSGNQKPRFELRLDDQVLGTAEVENIRWNFNPSLFKNILIQAGNHKLSLVIRDVEWISFDKIFLRKTSSLQQQTLEDGTVLLKGAGNQPVKEILPDGSQIFYRADGSTATYVFSDGTQIHYGGNAGDLKIFNSGNQILKTFAALQAPLLDESKTLRMDLEGGIHAYYLNGEPVEFRTDAGIRVTNFTLDASGNIQEALVTYPDGSQDIVWRGFRLRHLDADGTISDFTPQGFRVEEISPVGIQYYRYTKLSQHKVVGLEIFNASGAVSRYDEFGILREVWEPSGKYFNYSRMLQPDGSFQTALNQAVSSAADSKTFVQGKYAADGALKELLFQEGTRILFEAGKIKQVLDASGQAHNFTFQEIAGYLEGVQVQQDQTTLQYDSNAFLKSITTSQGQIKRIAQDSNGDGKITEADTVRLLLETVGGDTLSDFELDPDGHILNGILETKAGIKQKIQNGILTGFETSDGKIYDFQNNEAILREWHFKDGTRVVYGGGSITEILFPDGKRLDQIGLSSEKQIQKYTEELPDGSKNFFENGKRIRSITAEGNVLDYDAQGLAKTLTFPDGTKETITYEKDAAGHPTQVIFEDQKTRRIFDGAGNLKELFTNGVQASIQNGEILKLSTLFGEVDQPQWNASGILSGQIKFTDGAVQKIQQGQLAEISLPGGILIQYQNGRVSQIQTAEGNYNLIYVESNGSLKDIQIQLPASQGGTKQSFATYLLQHPNSSFAGIFLSAPLENTLADRSEIESQWSTGDTLFFAKQLQDPSRGAVYNFGNTYTPLWDAVWNSQAWSGGAIENDRLVYGPTDDLPEKTAMFLDMNADGLPDRVLMDNTSSNFWWVQLNNGQGFNSPTIWSGVDLSFYGGALREYDGRLPNILADLIDINGDGRPDRVMQRNDGSADWYVQINNGKGFDSTKIWTSNVQLAGQFSVQGQFASQARNLKGNEELVSELLDMDGDGLLDRLVRPYVAPFDRWFFQHNNGNGFDDAVLWTGVDLSNDADPKLASALSWDYIVTNNVRSPLQIEFENLSQKITDINNRPGPATSATQKGIDLKNALNEALALMNRTGMNRWLIEFNVPEPEKTLEVLKIGMELTRVVVGEQTRLQDMNGDGLPDRVLLKLAPGQNAGGSQAWYVQLNNGRGFDAAVLWDSQVRSLAGLTPDKAATSIKLFAGWEGPRNVLIDLIDVTGDGLPDRVSVDNNSFTTLQTKWWVEVNNGHGFENPVAWTGIEGSNVQETAITQEGEDYRAWTVESSPSSFRKISDLKDINGDHIPDRIIYREGNSGWLVQLGTGSGFLPAQAMQIQGLGTETDDISTSRYDFIHVSLKTDSSFASNNGKVHILLGDPADAQSYQEWYLTDLNSSWKDFYLPLDPAKKNAAKIQIRLETPNGAKIPISMDNLTFTSLRPPAAKDWLDRMLTQESILSEIHSDRTQTLAQYLGFVDRESGIDSQSAIQDSLLSQLLGAETKINFDTQGETRQFETLYGSVSKIENGRVMETVLPDGSKIEFQKGSDPISGSDPVTQIVTHSDGSVENLKLSYGRVRQVERPGQSPLEYSYEFVSEKGSDPFWGNWPSGTEITVVHDPDTELTERYIDNRLISRTDAQNVVTGYEYDAQGNLIRTTISYKGRVRSTFDHQTNEAGHRVITTEQGIQEEYDSQGTVLFHTTADGFSYAHSFEKAKKASTSLTTRTTTLPDGSTFSVQVPVVNLVEDPSGEDVQRVTLTGYEGDKPCEAGFLLENCQLGKVRASFADGQLTEILLADGTKISFDRFENKESMDSETGENQIERRLLDAVVTFKDGVKTIFREGLPSAVVSPSGQTVSLLTDKGNLINKNESAAFHLNHAEKIWQDTVLMLWKGFQVPVTLEIQSEYSLDGKLVTRQSGAGNVELYTDGRIEKILSRDGEALIQYEYDAEGNPTRIELGYARRHLESEVLKVKAEVAVENQKALAKVAEREQVINQTIEGQYEVARDQLLALRSQIESQQNQLASIKVKGKQAKGLISGALLEIEAGLDQINGALTSLANQRSDALAKLSSQVAQAKIDIDTQTQEAYLEIKIESDKAKKSILKQEITPVIYHWYRKILGRDPSQVEYNAVLDQANYETGNFNLENLKNQLLQLPELAARQAQVNAIKSRVESELLHYAAMNDEQKKSYAAGLGIQETERVTISLSEAQSLSGWLQSRSLHFGQSAYLSLEALLQSAHLSFDRVDLASQLILMDMLTGTLTPLEEGDLVLSLYAMRLVAARYGLSTQAYKMNFDTLKSLFDENCPGSAANPCDFRLVVHLDTNHYVIVTGIHQEARTESVERLDANGRIVLDAKGNPIFDQVLVKDKDGKIIYDERITYIDPGAGPENALDVQTLTQEQFMKAWIDPAHPNDGFGYVLSSRPPPVSAQDVNEPSFNPSINTNPLRYAVLNSHEQMAVRGAFFGFIWEIFKKIFEVVKTIVKSILETVKAIVTSVWNSIKDFFVGLGQIAAGLFTFNFSLMWQGFQRAFFTSTADVVQGLSKATRILTQETDSILDIVGAPRFIKRTFHTVEDLSSFVGWVDPHEDSFLSPKVVRTIQAGGKIVAGVVVFPVNPYIGTSLIVSGTSDILDLHTHLSPEIKSIINISAAAIGAFAGTGLDTGTLSGALAGLKSALPTLAKDLASVGVMAVGNSFGLDPRLSSLISLPVSAGIDIGVDSLLSADHVNLASLSAAIKNAVAGGGDSILPGVISFGAKLGLDQAGAPPLLQNFLPNLLGNLLAGSSSGSGGGGNFDSLWSRIADLAKGIGQAVVNGVKKIGQTVVSFGQAITNGFGQAIEKVSSLIPPQIKEFFISKGNGNLAAGVNSATVTNGNLTESAFSNYRLTYDNVSNDLTFANERLMATVRNVEFGQNGDIFTAGIEIAENLGNGDSFFEVYDNNGVLQELRFNDDIEILLNNNPFRKIEPLNFENAVIRLKLGELDSDSLIELRNVDGKLTGDLKIDLDKTVSLQDGIDFVNDIGAKIDSLQEVIGIPNAFADNITHKGYEPPNGIYAIKFFVDSPGNLGDNGKLVEVITPNGPARITGHSFVAISNGHGVDYRGLYPGNDVVFDEFYKLFMDVKGVVKTTDYVEHVQNNNYEIATDWYELTPDQFHRITEYVNKDHNYNLAFHSCTGFVLDIARMANIDLGYSPLIYANPQQLANAISEQQKQTDGSD